MITNDNWLYLNALRAELVDAEGAWSLPDADWTEELFHRSRLAIEALLAEVARLRSERDALAAQTEQGIKDLMDKLEDSRDEVADLNESAREQETTIAELQERINVLESGGEVA